jgi:hypothetical protein
MGIFKKYFDWLQSWWDVGDSIGLVGLVMVSVIGLVMSFFKLDEIFIMGWLIAGYSILALIFTEIIYYDYVYGSKKGDFKKTSDFVILKFCSFFGGVHIISVLGLIYVLIDFIIREINLMALLGIVTIIGAIVVVLGSVILYFYINSKIGKKIVEKKFSKKKKK